MFLYDHHSFSLSAIQIKKKKKVGFSPVGKNFKIGEKKKKKKEFHVKKYIF